MWSYLRLLALMSTTVLFGSVTYSASITGTVKGVDGAPFQGAFVEAQNNRTKITVEVLSDGYAHSARINSNTYVTMCGRRTPHAKFELRCGIATSARRFLSSLSHIVS